MAVAITRPGFASSRGESQGQAQGPGPTRTRAPLSSRHRNRRPDTRIVVFGSSAFVSDDVLGLAQQLESDFATSQTSSWCTTRVDWSLSDTDLLGIRSRQTRRPRALTVSTQSRQHMVHRERPRGSRCLGLLAVVGFAWLRRGARSSPSSRRRREMLTRVFTRILIAALGVPGLVARRDRSLTRGGRQRRR